MVLEVSVKGSRHRKGSSDQIFCRIRRAEVAGLSGFVEPESGAVSRSVKMEAEDVKLWSLLAMTICLSSSFWSPVEAVTDVGDSKPLFFCPSLF